MRLERLCVFCGSSAGARPEYAQMAENLGRVLASEGIELVYGGGRVGLMGILADGVIAGGGRVVGVIPEVLMASELAHTGVTRLEVVPDMHVRKARMAELSDGFIALPGGLGTFEELFEQLTWAQLGIHAKPAVLLDLLGFYEPLLELMRHAVDEGFMRAENLVLLGRATSPRQAIEMLRADRAPVTPKWIR